METLFAELKRYVGWSADDEAALRALHDDAVPAFERIADQHYQTILAHEEAKKALVGGESRVGQLKVLLVAWMDRLLSGPWDEDYYQVRTRIGRVHVRIALPQHYMFGAMNLIRDELDGVIHRRGGDPEAMLRTRRAVNKILDLELAIMLHTYAEDQEAQRARKERLATFGQLIGSIGHELRNPLAVIESSMYVIGQRTGGDERVGKHVTRVGEQLRVANGIISTLLDMIRDRPLVRETVSLHAVAESALSSLSPPTGVRVAIDELAPLPPLEGDATQLRQVLLNLMDNAIHAVGAAGEVRLSGRVDGTMIELVVDDSGPGVAPEAQRRLFEPLVTTKAKGIGLGLALVKRIVARHGGDIGYVPRPGAGARFVVRLPIGDAAR